MNNNNERKSSQDEAQVPLLTSTSFKDKLKKKFNLDLFLFVLEFCIMFSFSAIFSQIFILPFCNFLFLCGCTWSWDGGIEKCNINFPEGPHCPWCAAPSWINWIPQWGGTLVMLFTGLIVRKFWINRKSRWIDKQKKGNGDSHKSTEEGNESEGESERMKQQHDRKCDLIARWFVMILSSILVFYLFGIIHGWIFKETMGYPYFLSK